jgi:hypothetical protein
LISVVGAAAKAHNEMRNRAAGFIDTEYNAGCAGVR